MRKLIAGMLGVLLPLSAAAAQDNKTVPAGTPVTITVTPGQTPAPPVSISLGTRHAHVEPNRKGFTHTGGGNVTVAQPSPDTLVITMTGVAVAGGHPAKDSLASLHFDLSQCFEIAFDNPKVKRAKVSLEGQVVGLLRSHDSKMKFKCACGGSAEHGQATATVTGGAGGPGLSLSIQPHGVAGGQNLSVNCHEGPVTGPIGTGPHTLQICWSVTASHSKSILPAKAASAEFAPDPALDPLWISYWEPFHGASKKDFGLQITVKVAEDTEAK
jgi:hypothetical protein